MAGLMACVATSTLCLASLSLKTWTHSLLRCMRGDEMPTQR